MNFGDTLKRVLRTREGLGSLLIMVVSCVLAFAFAKLEVTRSISTMLQVVCFLAVIVASQQFSQIVMRMQEEGNQKQAGKQKKHK